MIPADLQQIYEEYARKLGQAHKKSSIFAGLFGQGSMGDARSDSCNRDFYDNTERWVAEFSATSATQEQIYEVCHYMMEAAVRSQGMPPYWYYLVAQGHLKLLIPQLTEEKRQILLEQYLKWYPKKEQLPIQREIVQLLSK